MKNLVLKLINSWFFRPIYVKHCSQTIYQILIGCVRLHEATKEKIWLDRAEKVCDILISIQQPDGGFDIGYEFNFGLLHKKGESTSPELVALSALMKFYKISNKSLAAEAAHKAVKWIKDKSVKLNENHWMIPYAPITTNNIMVYNGTSFAAGALGEYLAEFPDKDLDIIYRGMNSYLKSVMTTDQNSIGRFWFYADQTRLDLPIEALSKIDYYHQMQQVEAHGEAHLGYPDMNLEKIIEWASDHVASKQTSDGTIPYLNVNKDIHLWGLCSCASGFLQAGKVVESKNVEFKQRAREIYTWIEKHSWNGKYFYPIVSHEKEINDRNFYVRSDAWVFNSFAMAVKEGIESERYIGICEKSYQTMAEVDFSGLENHASNQRKRFYASLLIKAGKIKNNIWQK